MPWSLKAQKGGELRPPRPKRDWRKDKRDTATKRGYNDTDWQRCRKTVLKRDGFICQMCGERANVVHHEPPISGPDDPERANPDRCVAMCRSCHEQRHGRKS